MNDDLVFGIHDTQIHIVALLQWETHKIRSIKAGTLEKLVESLSSDVTGEMDSTYVSVFFATYR